ncbi:MAG: hypothetical protein JJE25_11510, partial [Bacteroidia bacterium]|nr:hypothetical protein [Bacteroidia bacterium]
NDSVLGVVKSDFGHSPEIAFLTPTIIVIPNAVRNPLIAAQGDAETPIASGQACSA